MYIYIYYMYVVDEDDNSRSVTCEPFLDEGGCVVDRHVSEVFKARQDIYIWLPVRFHIISLLEQEQRHDCFVTLHFYTGQIDLFADLRPQRVVSGHHQMQRDLTQRDYRNY